MQKKFKSFYFIVSSFVITILHLPFVFAKTASGSKFNQPERSSKIQATVVPLPLPAPAAAPVSAVKSVYDSLDLELKGLSQEAFDYAKEGFDKLNAAGKLPSNSILSIVDFSLPSNKKRLFIIDMNRYKVLYYTLVAHGRNTGHEWATSFSNQNETFKSSPGFYVTKETYQGKNGYSLKLDGLERGINDKAYERGIVIHGASYVNEANAKAGGFVGRSHGCPAVPVQLSVPLINTIKNGTCLFIYHPSYVNRSVLLAG